MENTKPDTITQTLVTLADLVERQQVQINELIAAQNKLAHFAAATAETLVKLTATTASPSPSQRVN
jgi:hypothetical protein